MSDSLQPHGLQHTRLLCPSPSPRVCSNSSPLSQWCHSTISSSVVPFFCCLRSFPASGSLPMSQLFTSGGQSIGASALASVFPSIRVFSKGLYNSLPWVICRAISGRKGLMEAWLVVINLSFMISWLFPSVTNSFPQGS